MAEDFFAQFGGERENFDEETLPRIENPAAEGEEEQENFFSQFGGYSEPEGQDVGKLESAARGGLQGATFNWADEIVARGGAGIYGAAKGVRSMLPGGVPEDAPDVGDVYRSILEQQRSSNQAAQDANPKTYLAGEVAGGAVSPIPLGKVRALKQGATLASKAAAAAKSGGLAGLAAGAGASEADLADGEFGELAKDTVVGGAVGAGLGGGIPLAGRGAQKIGQKASEAASSAAEGVGSAARSIPGVEQATAAAKGIRGVAGTGADIVKRAAKRARDRSLTDESFDRYAAGQALKATGLQGRSVVRNIGDIEDAEELGAWAIKKGIISPDSVAREEIQQRAAETVRKAGEDIGAIREAMQSAGYGPRAQDLIGQISRIQNPLRKLETIEGPRRLIGIADQVKQAIKANALDDGRVSPELLDQIKATLDDELYRDTGDKLNRLSQPAQELRSEIRKLFKKAEERVANQLGDTYKINGVSAKQRFLEAKEEYGRGLDLLKITDIQDERDLANLGLGLREAGLLGMATMAGSPVTGAALIAGKRATDSYGNATAAQVAMDPRFREAARQTFAAGRAIGAGAGKVASGARAAKGAATAGAKATWQKTLDLAQEDGPRGVAAAGALLISQYPELEREIIDEVRRRLGPGGLGPPAQGAR